jgi:FMN phosphatase YigB (HAD superfamily)
MPKILYIDMDNVLVDFRSGIARLNENIVREFNGRLDDVPGIFALMEPMEDAVESFKTLSQHLIHTFYRHRHGRIQVPGATNCNGSNGTWVCSPISG